MKKQFVLASWFTLLFFALMVSCVKEGPVGPAGADGIDGTNGIDGVDGTDGTATCMRCHDSGSDLVAKQVQYQNSIHALGGNFERNSTSCAICHTHEGFLERLATGANSTAAAISDPTPVNCRTCHKIHETYTEADYELRVTGPVDLINGGTVDFGNGNMCINCHQSRPYEIPDMANDSTTITSSRWGTHHGPQSAMVFGLGGFEIPGDLSYSNSPHSQLVTDGCITCHMAEAFGNSAGGHTFNMTYIYHGGSQPNMVGCVACHAEADDFNVNGAQDEIEELLLELEGLLIAKGVYNTNSGLWNTGTYETNVAGAALNYIFVKEDRSDGVHNFNYARALLKNSIDAIQ